MTLSEKNLRSHLSNGNLVRIENTLEELKGQHAVVYVLRWLADSSWDDASVGAAARRLLSDLDTP